MDDTGRQFTASSDPQLKFAKPARRRTPKPNRQAVYAQVDTRDRGCCRVCGRFTSVENLLAPNGRHHHHLVYRSRGGKDDTANVVTLCASCHRRVHEGGMRLSGNADDRDERGRGCVQHLRPSESGWQIVGWV